MFFKCLNFRTKQCSFLCHRIGLAIFFMAYAPASGYRKEVKVYLHTQLCRSIQVCLTFRTGSCLNFLIRRNQIKPFYGFFFR